MRPRSLTALGVLLVPLLVGSVASAGPTSTEDLRISILPATGVLKVTGTPADEWIGVSAGPYDGVEVTLGSKIVGTLDEEELNRISYIAIYGGGGDDALTAVSVSSKDGNLYAFRLYGERGNDVLVGSAQATAERVDDRDGLYGGVGDDFAVGGSGHDLIDGGSGADVLYGDGKSTPAGSDEIAGGAGADVLYGSPGSDVLNGGADADCLYGEDGNDRADAGAGDDFVDGGRGADDLQGGAGADRLRARDGEHDNVDGGPPTHGDVASLDGNDNDNGIEARAANSLFAPGKKLACKNRTPVLWGLWTATQAADDESSLVAFVAGTPGATVAVTVAGPGGSTRKDVRLDGNGTATLSQPAEPGTYTVTAAGADGTRKTRQQQVASG